MRYLKKFTSCKSLNLHRVYNQSVTSLLFQTKSLCEKEPINMDRFMEKRHHTLKQLNNFHKPMNKEDLCHILHKLNPSIEINFFKASKEDIQFLIRSEIYRDI